MNMSNAFSCAALAAFAFLVWSSPPDEERGQEPRPSVAGSWTLNEDRSEKYDPQRDRDLNRRDITGSDVRTGMGGRSSGRSGGGGGGGGDAGGGSGFGGGGMNRQAMRAMQEATRPPKTLHISQTDSSVTVGGPGRPLTLLTNGEMVADSTLEGEIVYSAKAQWKKEQLVIERTIGGGATMIRQTYYLDKKDPKMLIVDLRFEDKPTRRTIDLRRIYDPSPG